MAVSIIQLVEQLHREGKTGIEIVQELLRRDLSHRDILNALYYQRYVARVIGDRLHVSNQPMGAGLAVLVTTDEPETMPSVPWTTT